MKALIFCSTLVSCLPLATASNVAKHEGAFPVIDPAAQKDRDITRRQILEDEMATEVARTAQARAELAAAESMRKPANEIGGLKDAVRRHEANIDALNNELSRAGAQRKMAAAPVRKNARAKVVITSTRVVPPVFVGKYDGYQKPGDEKDDPYDGYAVSSSE